MISSSPSKFCAHYPASVGILSPKNAFEIMKQVSDEWMSVWKTGVDLPKSSEGFTPSCFTTILLFFFFTLNLPLLQQISQFISSMNSSPSFTMNRFRFGFPSWCCSSQRPVPESISSMNFYWLKFFFVEKITVFLMKALLCFFFSVMVWTLSIWLIVLWIQQIQLLQRLD